MFKRIFALALLFAAASSRVDAGPLRSDDPNYRGAFTILAAGRIDAATATYHTEVIYNNESDHPVWIRLEVYGLNGYREAILPNPILPGIGAGLRWGMLKRTPDGEVVAGRGADIATHLLGDDIGALRIVAVDQNGNDDLTAKISGYGRLWILPNHGGRLSELQPGFTDAELTGPQRRDESGPGFGRSTIYRPFDAWRSRMNLAVINFDTTAPVELEVGSHTSTDVDGETTVRPAMQVTVPPGSMRMVPVATVGTGLLQVITMASPANATNWISYVSVVDNQSGDVSLRFDVPTELVLSARR